MFISKKDKLLIRNTAYRIFRLCKLNVNHTIIENEINKILNVVEPKISCAECGKLFIKVRRSKHCSDKCRIVKWRRDNPDRRKEIRRRAYITLKRKHENNSNRY